MADGQKPRFQRWQLLAYIVGWPPLTVGLLYLTGGSLPSRKHLDEYTYRHAWITFLAGMAMTGAVIYLMNLFMSRRAHDRSKHCETRSGSFDSNGSINIG